MYVLYVCVYCVYVCMYFVYVCTYVRTYTAVQLKFGLQHSAT